MPSDKQLPEKLAHAIELCITRISDDRWQSASDLKRSWFGLQAPLTRPPGRGVATRAAAMGGAGVSTLAFIHSSVGWYNATRPAELKQLMRLNGKSRRIRRWRGDIGSGIRGNMLALSPTDGTRLARSARGADRKVRPIRAC